MTLANRTKRAKRGKNSAYFWSPMKTFGGPSKSRYFGASTIVFKTSAYFCFWFFFFVHIDLPQPLIKLKRVSTRAIGEINHEGKIVLTLFSHRIQKKKKLLTRTKVFIRDFEASINLRIRAYTKLDHVRVYTGLRML